MAFLFTQTGHKMRDSEIVRFDNDFVYAILLTGPHRGMEQKIPRDKVRPQEWIAVGERIWHVEHGYWDFHRMFDMFYDTQIKRIKDKLAHCRKHNLEVFGSDSHQFKLRSCLTESALRLFEEKLSLIPI